MVSEVKKKMGIKVKEGRCVFCGAKVDHVRAYNCICEKCAEERHIENRM